VQQRQTATITLHLEGDNITDDDLARVVEASMGAFTIADPDLRLVKVVATKRAELEL
jgi:hypothetical protein